MSSFCANCSKEITPVLGCECGNIWYCSLQCAEKHRECHKKTCKSAEREIWETMNQKRKIEAKMDEDVVMEKLRKMKLEGRDIKQFMFKAVYQLCYDEKENENDNKNKNQDEKEKELSQLIDITQDEMCKLGHWFFRDHNGDHQDVILNNKCVECGGTKDRMFCNDCASYDLNSFSAAFWGSHIDESDVKEHIYCIHCRWRNAENIKERIEINKMKAEIIRTELIADPTLERDILCDMGRRAAVDKLIGDINQLDLLERSQWILLMFDMDYLKTWNTSIGHIATDKLIQAIGDVMHKYVKQINDGQWHEVDENGAGTECSLSRAFVFRTGGDEFVMFIKCDHPEGASSCKLYNFYSAFQSEINQLASIVSTFIDENEWKEAEINLSNATDRNGNKINLDIVGLSCGIFIPTYARRLIVNWLDITDTKALETAKNSNGINKNGCAIFYEGDSDVNGIIPTDQVVKCLKDSVIKVLVENVKISISMKNTFKTINE